MEKAIVLSADRCMDLLDSIIRYVSSTRNTHEAVHELMLMGFTVDELINNFGFSEDDVVMDGDSEDDAGMDGEDMQYMRGSSDRTFSDLYKALDFGKGPGLRDLGVPEWEMELYMSISETAILYRKGSRDMRFRQRMEIRFDIERDTVSINIFDSPDTFGRGKTISADTPISSISWAERMFADVDFGWGCRQALVEFADARYGKHQEGR